MKYLPFLTGIYSVAPGLIPMHKAEVDIDKKVFQIDEYYTAYLQNKTDCRKENLYKYYCEHNLFSQTAKQINIYIANQLQKEYPSLFEFTDEYDTCFFSNIQTKEIIQWNKETMQLAGNKYVSVFDALCSQVQEDLAVCQLQNNKDWLAAIHLCAPNHWAAEEKIGKTFDVVHAPVAGMQKTFPHYFKMLQSIVEKGSFTRFAWGISTDKKLNHHPVAPKGINKNEWHGRKIEEGATLYIRTERQNLIGFADMNAFLFTIRTYFYEVEKLEDNEKKVLWSAVRSMSPQSLMYKGLTNATDFLEKNLFHE